MPRPADGAKEIAAKCATDCFHRRFSQLLLLAESSGVDGAVKSRLAASMRNRSRYSGNEVLPAFALINHIVGGMPGLFCFSQLRRLPVGVGLSKKWPKTFRQGQEHWPSEQPEKMKRKDYEKELASSRFSFALCRSG